MFTDTDTTTPARHRVHRSSLLNNLRERRAETAHHGWSAAGMDKPWDHKGRHTDTTRTEVTR